MQSDLAENLKDIRRRINDAAGRVGRDANEIKLVAVSKTHSADVLRQAIDAGTNILGENKVQEAESKIAELGRYAAEWHLIGHLQSNKARKAVQLFDVIQSLDSIELAERLERICEEEDRSLLRVFIQVDLAGEEKKSGVAEADLPALIGYLKTCKRLHPSGLMIVPPFDEDVEKTRPYFKRMLSIRDHLLPNGELSMGMSHDFETAIEEGATVVRVGTAIFGQRDYQL